MNSNSIKKSSSDWENWAPYRAITPRNLTITFIVFVLLTFSAHNAKIDKAAIETGKAILFTVGIGDSEVLDGAIHFIKQAFPLQISQRTEISRLEHFNPDSLPLFSYIETGESKEYDALTDSWEIETTKFLVQPIGYLTKVLFKMLETIEIGFWGTVLSVMISLPLGILASRNYTPHKQVYFFSRGWLSFHRAMPELIIALILVLMYGFGPIAGVLALAIHTSGVLGKFFADEIENAPPGPQQALASSGAGTLKVLRYSVFPHVFPAWIAYVQYVFERNIRTATVLGIVGAGGIGMELKGRWDLFDYDHVTTILLVIFLTVVLLECLSQKVRKKAL